MLAIHASEIAIRETNGLLKVRIHQQVLASSFVQQIHLFSLFYSLPFWCFPFFLLLMWHDTLP